MAFQCFCEIFGLMYNCQSFHKQNQTIEETVGIIFRFIDQVNRCVKCDGI